MEEMNTHATIEEFSEEALTVRSVPSLHSEHERDKLLRARGSELSD
jgi:hypothetical protein